MADPLAPAAPEPGDAKTVSRRRRLLTGLGVVIVVIFAIYVSLYAVSMCMFRNRVNADVQTNLGVQDAFSLTGSLQPFGLALQAGALTFNAAGGQQTPLGQVDGARIAVPLLMPWHILSELRNLTIDTDGWTLLVPQVSSWMDLAPESLSYRVTLTDLRLGQEGVADADTVRLPHTVFSYTRRLADHSPAQPEEAVTFEAAPVLLPAAAAPKPGMPAILDSISLHLASEPAFPRVNATPDMGERRAALAAWQQAGGAVTLGPLVVGAYGMTATLTGPLQLDPDLALNGKFTLSLSGVAQAYDALAGYNARFHMMPDQQFKTFATMLRMIPGNADKSFSFQLGLHRHWLTFMNAPVYRYGAMSWEIVPFSTETPDMSVPADGAGGTGAATVLPDPVPEKIQQIQTLPSGQ